MLRRSVHNISGFSRVGKYCCYLGFSTAAAAGVLCTSTTDISGRFSSSFGLPGAAQLLSARRTLFSSTFTVAQAAGKSESKFVDGAKDADDAAAAAGGGKFEYDLVVIGGGSGGIAAAKRAASLGAKVALCDFVAPAANTGTTWGLGGTCVNVGCIPKKLMHTSAMLGETLKHQASSYGWGAEESPLSLGDTPAAAAAAAVDISKIHNADLISFSWQRLRQNVHAHIRSLNFGYVSEMRGTENIVYLNADASFVDRHTLRCVDKKGKETLLRGRRFLIATGGRPTPLSCPGSEHCISSDDLFWSKHAANPGKTLVVGASYIALECAGLLQSFNFPCTVLARSIPLRTMDQQCAAYVTDDITKRVGVKIVTGALPTKIEKDAATGKLKVEYTVQRHRQGGGAADDIRVPATETVVEEFDTVVAAIGRSAETKRLNLGSVGVETNKSSGKIVANKFCRTSVPNIYAVGDVVHDCPELTPVAIKQSNLLCDRLFASDAATKTLDYSLVPTTVFTPLEYGFVGHSEESAVQNVARGDATKIESYIRAFTPLEWTVPHLPTDSCFMKLVVEKETDRVLGFHVVAPNAGEITQGVAVAFNSNKEGSLLRQHFLDTVGIHPTVAEDMTQLTVSKSSGAGFGKGGC